jgi:3'-phosphoadenosine 5'-phosphosulfate sulfotransferase (PAPS reductase)/FAD synthetase
VGEARQADGKLGRLTLRDRFRDQINGVLVDPWDTGLVVLAVSGGSDSTALMQLAAGSLMSRVYVITVDPWATWRRR